jgi:hypothetical protein
MVSRVAFVIAFANRDFLSLPNLLVYLTPAEDV